MNLHEYLSVAPEIAEAIAQGKPVVALESTILSHGMPYPENVELPTRSKRSSVKRVQSPQRPRSWAAS